MGAEAIVPEKLVKEQKGDKKELLIVVKEI